MTTRDVLAAGRLPRHECERLLIMATGRSRREVAAGYPLDDDAAMAYSVLCKRRVAGEPLQYIEGSVPFGGAEIAVDGRVLIPRPETEYLWEQAVQDEGPAPGVIVDLCTGSGALAVALALAFPESTVWATELSASAAELARANASSNGTRVEVVVGDLFEPLPGELAGRVDLLVANPPYVGADEFESLPAGVRDWEPGMALVGGETGLEVVARIAGRLSSWLAPDGRFYIEINERHGDEASHLFGDGYRDVEVRKDLAGRDRYVVGRRA